MNRILRICKDPTILFIIQPYFRDLFVSIQTIYKNQQNIVSKQIENKEISYKKFTCYRGGTISDNEVKFFTDN